MTAAETSSQIGTQTATQTLATAEPAERVEALGPLIEAHASEGERLGRIAQPAQDALVEAGLFRMLMPRSHGGMETEPPAFLRAIEAAAKHDASTAWCLCQGNGCAMAGAYLGHEAGQEIFGRDPKAILAWGPGKAEARAVDGGYRVSGRLAFASGGRHATWLGCHVPVIEPDGTRRLDPDGKPLILTCLFPEPEVTWIDTWDVIGLRATGSDDFEVKDIFVPAEHTTVRDNARTRTTDSRLYVMPSMSMYAIGFSATAQGIARAMLDAFMDLATEKTPRLAGSKLKDNPVIQSDIGHCEARLRSARALLVAEVDDIWDEVQRTGALSIENRYRIRLASTHGIHEAKAVAETVYDLAGVSSIRADSPFQRRYRDIRSVTQQLQGRRSHFQTVGAFLMGHPPDMGVV